MTVDPTEAAVKAAFSVARDLTEGRLTAADLEAQCLDEHRRTFGRVVGPGDPLWELQLDVCRQVLAAKGVPADELVEWTAVARAVEEPKPPVSWIEQALAAGADEDDDDPDEALRARVRALTIVNDEGPLTT